MRIARSASALAAALGLFFLAACSNPFVKSDDTAGDMATLTISIGTNPRAVVAGSGDFFAAIAAYTITVSNADHTYTSTTVTSGSCSITDIISGTYDITVQAYSDSGRTTEIAEGTATAVAIATGSTTSATVTLSFSRTASTGSFSLDVAWPSSTGLGYVYAVLDDTTTISPTDLTTSSSSYTAKLAASSLAGGAHPLKIYFKTASGATASVGPFTETVNIWDEVESTMWADSSGSLHATFTLSSSDFVDTSCALSGLSVDTAGLDTTFDSATYAYKFGSLTTGTSYSFTITAASAVQEISATFNAADCSLTAISGTTLTGSFTAASGENTLKIIVTAADRVTSQSYDVSAFAGGIYTASDFLSTISANETYVLGSDITISDGWNTSIPSFSGAFNGGGHTIDLGSATVPLLAGLTGTVSDLTVNAALTSSGDVGLICSNLSGTIENCVSTGSVTTTSSGSAGGICASMGSGTTITNCANNATITATSTNYCGGIVGVGFGAVEYCYNTGTVNGMGIVGGVTGLVRGGTTQYCYNTGTVSGTSAVGGIAGQSELSLSDCYNRGSISASVDKVGGVCGYFRAGTMTNCYSTGTISGTTSYIGGAAGTSGSGATACFFDSETSGYISGTWLDVTNVTATTTADMKTASTYNAWDISETLGASTVWGIDTTGSINGGYPYLQYFGANTATP